MSLVEIYQECLYIIHNFIPHLDTFVQKETFFVCFSCVLRNVFGGSNKF